MRATATKNPQLHPTLMRRLGAAVETALIVVTLTAIWVSVGWVLIGALLKQRPW